MKSETKKETKMQSRIRSVLFVADHLNINLDGRTLPENFYYIGTLGGNHYVKDHETRVWCVDLVTRDISMCAGVLPKGISK